MYPFLTRKCNSSFSATRGKGSTMGKSKQVGNHKSDKKKHISKTWKTKRRTKDLDQIHSDMKPDTATKLLNQEVDYDVTGCAQHYCLHCARYFMDMRSLKEHFKTKGHKKRLKLLREEPYTQAEAERAAGMGSYIAPKTVEVKTQTVEEDMD
ncbi:zinc finger protein 593 [Etheostoma spectabile]|nr:zinc finger protein 593 [Etheostoma spectabile]